MEEADAQKMPTGIHSFDPVLGGGVPPGSVVLLLGGVGAGHREFAYSSVLNLAKEKENPSPRQGLIIPEEIVYVTVTKLSESIISEIQHSFKDGAEQNLKSNITFIDLSEQYFESSVVPPDWYRNGALIDRYRNKRHEEANTIIGALSSKLTEMPEKSLIVVDSLTEIATAYSSPAEWKEFISLLRGLERVAKKWNSTIYFILTNNILQAQQNAEIADCADAVLTFQWEQSSAQKRQRTVFIEKFREIMPHLEENDLVKFAVRITAESGFEVSNIRVII
jgi:KaiC/GvpD/RAD55 family RecA-like ATPase